MAKSRWNRKNINIILSFPEDKEAFYKIKKIYNQFVEEQILDKIKELPEERREGAIIEIKERLK